MSSMFPWRVTPKTPPGTLVTLDPAGPGMDVSFWVKKAGYGSGRTRDAGPYVLMEILPPTAPNNSWRPARCIHRNGEEFFFSHYDLKTYLVERDDDAP